MDRLSDEETGKYGKMVSLLSNRMISDKETAEDAAQEVWIEIINSLISGRAADTVVLGCTELPLMIKDGDLNALILNTTQMKGWSLNASLSVSVVRKSV